MNRNTTIKTLIKGVLLLVLFIIPASLNAGFGVSPPFVIENNLVPGSEFERTIFLVQNENETDIPVQITVEGQVAEWLSFEKGMEQVIPANTQKYPLVVKLSVPDDAEINKYTGAIRVQTIPDENAVDGQVAIALAAKIEVQATVGDNVVVDYEVLGISFKDVFEGNEAAASVLIKNNGNVSAAPSRISYELLNKYGDVRLDFVDLDEFDEKISSFSEGEISFVVPLSVKLQEGEYWGNITVYNQDGEKIAEEKSIFSVSKKTFSEALKSFGTILIGIIVIIVLALFVYRTLLILKKKKADTKQKSKKRKKTKQKK